MCLYQPDGPQRLKRQQLARAMRGREGEGENEEEDEEEEEEEGEITFENRTEGLTSASESRQADCCCCCHTVDFH